VNCTGVDRKIMITHETKHVIFNKTCLQNKLVMVCDVMESLVCVCVCVCYMRSLTNEIYVLIRIINFPRVSSIHVFFLCVRINDRPVENICVHGAGWARDQNYFQVTWF